MGVHVFVVATTTALDSKPPLFIKTTTAAVVGVAADLVVV